MNEKIINDINGIEVIFIKKVLKLEMIFSENNNMDLIINCSYSSLQEVCNIIINLNNVIDFEFSNKLSSGYIDISELKIIDIRSRQLEICKYKIEDYGGSGFNCFCKEIFITKSKK